jgi:glycosyltransferase involved in cell wall biosynthesis
MKKILLYFAGNINDSKGTPNRVRTISEILVSAGYEIYFAGKVKPLFVDEAHFFSLPRPISRLAFLYKIVKKEKIQAVFFQTSAHITLLALLSRLLSVPCGCDFHSLLFEEELYYGKISKFEYSVRKFVDLVAAKQLDFATGVCGSLREYYSKSIPKFEILSAVADDVFFDETVAAFEPVLAWKGDAILIGYAGNGKDYQGIDILIQAMKMVEKKKPESFKLLLVISSGFEEVKKAVEEVGLLEKTYLLPQQPHDMMPKILRASDVLVIPRRDAPITRFAFPSKIAEYAAMAKPIIVTNVGDLSLFIKDGVNGFVVEPDRADQLTDKILCMDDNVLRSSMSRAIHETARKHFHSAAFRKILDSLFQEIIK